MKTSFSDLPRQEIRTPEGRLVLICDARKESRVEHVS